MTYVPASRDGSRLTRITITLPTNLVGELDRVAGRGGRSRFTAEAVASRLRSVTQARAMRAADSALGDVTGAPDPMSLADWLDAIRRPRA